MLSRVHYADILRVGATIGVVVFHTTGATVRFGEANWWFEMTVASCGLVCVPIFVMVSGALLLDTAKEESTRVLFLKRFRRVVIPFIAWSILYWLWSLVGQMYHEHHFYLPISGFVRDFIRGNVTYAPHLWFFYALIPVYVVTPILRTCIKKTSGIPSMCFLLLWVVAMAVYIAVGAPNWIVKMLMQSVLFLGYFVLGYFLSTAEIGAKLRNLMYVVAACGLFATIFGTYFLTRSADGVFRYYFYSYYATPVIAMSVGLFVACRSIRWPDSLSRFNWPSRLLAAFVSASLGIFMVHWAILQIVSWLWPSYSSATPFVRIPIASVLAVSVSFVVVRIMQRIPLVKRIVL